MTQRYAFVDQDENGDVTAYPASDPFTQRDQGNYPADELVAYVIGDIGNVLRAANFTEEADTADRLYRDACALWGGNGPSGWLDVDTNPDGPEVLRSLLSDAESLPHAYVIWNGDAGTVRVTTSIWVSVSDPARQLTDEEVRTFDVDLYGPNCED